MSLIKKLGSKRVIVSLLLVFQVLGLISAVHAVLSVRTPQGSIAWAVSLVTFPYVAVPAYWVFGRDKFQGYVLARQQDLAELQQQIDDISEGVDPWQLDQNDQRGAATAAEVLARVPITGNNEAELLVNGEATFDSIFAGIDAAKDYALVQFYIVRADDLGLQLRDRLVAAAKRGVAVYFLFDEVGSLGLPTSYRQSMTDAGIQVSPFHSRKGSGNRFQLNFRNHRKTVVVDGQQAWVGGHNVGDEYLATPGSSDGWRDTHVRIAGPATIGAQLAFVEDWRWATDQELHDLNWVPDRPDGATDGALVISSGPADTLETAALMYTGAINAAKRRIWIASPYFVPDDAIVQALQLAALRGVDVRILIPEKSDNMLVTLAAYTYFDDVKNVGVKFYRYQAGFLHQKAALIDNNVATIGTANFDNRSFRLNFEITALVISEDFAGEVEQMFEQDFTHSRMMDAGEYDQRPWWFRVMARISRLAAPVL